MAPTPSRPRRPSAAMLVALLALFVALGGPAQAAKVINGNRIKRDSVASKQIRDRSLKLRDLAPSAVDALTTTPNDSITTSMLRENAIDAQSIAPGSVLTGHVVDDSLTAADLGPGAVGADEVADNAVGQPEIRPNGVASSEVADGSLSIRDVARQVGTMTWPVPGLPAGKCDVKPVRFTGVGVTGSFLLLMPTTPWPEALVYDVIGATAANEFTVQACAIGPVPGATYKLNYAVLGL